MGSGGCQKDRLSPGGYSHCGLALGAIGGHLGLNHQGLSRVMAPPGGHGRTYAWRSQSVSIYYLAQSSHNSVRVASTFCALYLGLAQDHPCGSFGAGPRKPPPSTLPP